ncbi:MFS transporter [Paraburkholderia phenazinium]|uniref:MFS transporter, MHS family, proline/betaine transporter n=1 Tax=Paraburkholderia phenazinium TaxID=60549 RepID=A0A1G7TW40_9BURK|nr:MFS transporter [Paraburkholderia phenazinium]SDG39371.1 MFS transporter, MHS family, proline/betaine transporter [Paraburkholderia phenazinium]
MRRQLNPVLKIALTANLFEWYEFSLTAFMALEIGRLFFPATSDKTALLLSFSVFASSYLARPFGSVFFGILGNRRGAGAALKLSMIGMAIPASLIAFLPIYKTAGYLATGLLVGLKILQGFAAGGEMPLSGYFVSLNSADKNRGLYCSVLVVSGFLGMLLASGIVFVLPYGAAMLARLLGGEGGGYLTESWRWPFLFCIPLSLWIYSLRSSISAIPDGEARHTSHARPAWPLVQAVILVAFMEMHLYTAFVWLPAYLHSYLGVATFDAHLTNVITLLIFSMAMVAAGYATRWIDASNLVLIGIVSLICTSYPLFAMLQHGDFLTLLLVQAAFAVMAGCLVGVIFVVLPDLFKDNWRSFGMASTYSLSTALFGGTAPVVCAYLIKVTHLLTAPALYIMAMGLLAVPIAYGISLKNRRQRQLCVDLTDSEQRRASSSILQP